MARQFLVTTTGTLSPVVFDDLGARTILHPTVDLDFLLEFTIEEIINSDGNVYTDIQYHIDMGHITVIDEFGNPITDVGTIAEPPLGTILSTGNETSGNNIVLTHGDMILGESSPVSGGDVDIIGGVSVSGDGGDLMFAGGATVSGAGGDLIFAGGDGLVGGDVDIFGGDSTSGGTGDVTIQGLIYPSTDGTAGQAITTDGFGNLTFTSVSGGSSDVTLISATVDALSANQQIISGDVSYLSGVLDDKCDDIDIMSGDIIYLSGQIDAITGGGGTANSGDIVFLSGAIDELSAVVSAKCEDIDIISGDIIFLSGAIDANLSGDLQVSADLAYLSASIDVNTTNISTLSSVIDVNTTNISILTGDVSFLSGAHDALSAIVSAKCDDIDIISGDVSNLSAFIDVNTTNISNLSGEIDDVNNQLTGVVLTTTNQTISGLKTFVDDTTVLGDFMVCGTTTTINSSAVMIADNTILLNNGEIGAGVTLGTAGIAIDRGTLVNVELRWNESSDTWQVTEDGTNYFDILHDGNLSVNSDIVNISGSIDQNATDILSVSAVLSAKCIDIDTISGDVLELQDTLAKDTFLIPTTETRFGGGVLSADYRSGLWQVTLFNELSAEYEYVEVAGIHIDGGITRTNIRSRLGDNIDTDICVELSGGQLGLNVTNNEAVDITLQYIRLA